MQTPALLLFPELVISNSLSAPPPIEAAVHFLLHYSHKGADRKQVSNPSGVNLTWRKSKWLDTTKASPPTPTSTSPITLQKWCTEDDDMLRQIVLNLGTNDQLNDWGSSWIGDQLKGETSEIRNCDVRTIVMFNFNFYITISQFVVSRQLQMT